ncbi:metallophosphoesterase family protein [Candidatus Poribacteria bacterium]
MKPKTGITDLRSISVDVRQLSCWWELNRIGKAIEDLCLECGFAGYYETSAKKGRNIKSFRRVIAKALDWDNLARTSRPELFQQIYDDIEERRKNGEVVLLLEDLKDAIKEAYPEIYEEAAIKAVSDQLATQGVLAQTKLMSGEDALVLQLPVLERYAGSLIVAAQNNPRGVPALEERLLGSSAIPLPGIKKKERLKRIQERVVLECIAELMIQNGICFRHEGLLIFPTLFPEVSGDSDEKIPHSVSLYYDFTGAIDNMYASLVARLMISQEFGEGRLWPGRVDFDHPGQGVCGIRQIKRTGGLAHVDLFFAEDTVEKCRSLFTGFVEDHLKQHGVEIREHQAIECRGCGEEIAERVVQENIARGERDVICSVCRTHTLISEGVAKIRERDSELDQTIFALKNVVDERMAEDAQKAKEAVTSGGTAIAKTDNPIRLLHLSDLHFTDDTSPKTKLQWLLQDICGDECLGCDAVEYLVISGDMTDKGSEEGLDRAREFVSMLNKELGVSAQRCIFVPGNHDVQDMEESYDWYMAETRAREIEPDEGLWHREGSVIFVPNKDEYPNRIKQFSDAFFHKIIQKPYPLEYDQQGIAYLFPDTKIQFLTLNSCWQIDQFNRKRSSLHPDAAAHAIEQADKQIQDAIERGDMKKRQKTLRFCVWHHSIQHRETMQNTDVVENLQKAGVRICLHGDVHEENREQYRYWRDDKMYIVGAGSFGSPAEGRPESIPRLYNLLEIERDFSSVRVHTRRQMKPDGSWEGGYEWPDPEGGKGRVPYYDITLKQP